MLRLFLGAAPVDQSIGNWDTSSVTNMAGLFTAAARFDQPISDRDISLIVTIMGGFFAEAASFRQTTSPAHRLGRGSCPI